MNAAYMFGRELEYYMPRKKNKDENNGNNSLVNSQKQKHINLVNMQYCFPQMTRSENASKKSNTLSHFKDPNVPFKKKSTAKTFKTLNDESTTMLSRSKTLNVKQLPFKQREISRNIYAIPGTKQSMEEEMRNSSYSNAYIPRTAPLLTMKSTPHLRSAIQSKITLKPHHVYSTKPSTTDNTSNESHSIDAQLRNKFLRKVASEFDIRLRYQEKTAEIKLSRKLMVPKPLKLDPMPPYGHVLKDNKRESSRFHWSHKKMQEKKEIQNKNIIRGIGLLCNFPSVHTKSNNIVKVNIDNNAYCSKIENRNKSSTCGNDEISQKKNNFNEKKKERNSRYFVEVAQRMCQLKVPNIGPSHDHLTISSLGCPKVTNNRMSSHFFSTSERKMTPKDNLDLQRSHSAYTVTTLEVFAEKLRQFENVGREPSGKRCNTPIDNHFENTFVHSVLE